ncbi:MAG: hypothetical protein JJU46_14760 [Balneolaceae bacterium]|nr:hypothetical protein [Balneolaceae bacterium]MCH8549205.1 hypothetical protein [Balneolaceae bacterium]
MNKNILLIGGGDFTKKTIRLINNNTSYNIVGYTDIKDSGKLFGVNYLGTDLIVENIKATYDVSMAVICIAGNLNLISKRAQIVDHYKKAGYSFPTIESKNAFIDPSAEKGEGTLIFDNAYIDFETKIESFSVINIGACICHNSVIGTNSVISPNSTVLGGAIIGSNCFLGTNTTINPRTTVSDNILIGSAGVVHKDLTSPGVYVGNPLKKIR